MSTELSIENLSDQQIAQLQKEYEARLAGPVFLDVGDKKKPMGTLANFEILMRHYGITIRYNEMTKEEEIDIPGYTGHADLEQNAKLAQLISLANLHRFPKSDIDAMVIKIASANSYHPVRNWIEEIKWDGQDRRPDFYSILELETYDPLKETMMRKWALSAVAALYHPGFSCEGVLTLTGPQGLGKTTMATQLIPSGAKWYKDGVHLDLNNKDTVFKALGSWITELGEIDTTFKRSEISQLKAFLTEREDILRPPYARKANKYSRRTVFFGSVNSLEFLQDEENRRFWVLRVRSVQTVEFNVQQFWAQMREEYLALLGKIETKALREKNQEWGWFLSPNERRQLTQSQEQFKSLDPIGELFHNHIDVDASAKTGRYMNITEIFKELGIDRPNKIELNGAAIWLRKNGLVANRHKKFKVVISKEVIISKENEPELRIMPNFFKKFE
jgi:putative DNA primase/helicase